MSRGKHAKKPLVWGGLKFESNEDMANFVKTSSQLIRHYLKKDKPFPEVRGCHIDYAI